MGVRITGTGLHPFGRFEGKTPTDMGVHAVRAALDEAGHPAFQAAFCGTAYGGVASGHKVLGALARTGMPIVDVEAGCASGGAALQLAAGAIRAGQYDCVLVFGVEKMPKGIIRSSFFEPWREEGGLAVTPAYFALRAQRVMRESGVTKEHLARVVVKNRTNGADNPNAMYQKPTTADDVLASRVVCEPLHLHMLCSPNEGAAAVVLQRASASAATNANDDGVRIAAVALRSHLPGSVLGEATPMAAEPRRTLTEAQRPLANFLELVATRLPPRNFPEERDYDDASWVGYRLAEVLPLPLPIKQSMLEISDADVRLTVLQKFLAQQGLL